MSLEPVLDIPMDFSVFENTQSQLQSNCIDFQSCAVVRRLLSCLSYYSSLMENKEEPYITFTNFIQKQYTIQLVIEDFHHFHMVHDRQTHDIVEYAIDTDLLNKCNIATCKYSSRHYRVSADHGSYGLFDDPQLNLFCDIMDSFHHYLIHLHDIGMRIGKHKYEDVDDKQNEFASITEMMNSIQTTTSTLSQISSGSKFKIDIGNENQNSCENVETYLDVLIDSV